MSTLISKQPAIALIELEDTHVYNRYEVGRGTNLSAVAKKYAEAPMHEDLQFTVDRLVCKDGKLQLSTNLLPGASVPINMAKIEMKDVHHGKPLTAARPASLFLRTLLKEVLTVKGLGASIYDTIGDELNSLDKDVA